jgi:hypothetical protein
MCSSAAAASISPLSKNTQPSKEPATARSARGDRHGATRKSDPVNPGKSRPAPRQRLFDDPLPSKNMRLDKVSDQRTIRIFISSLSDQAGTAQSRADHHSARSRVRLSLPCGSRALGTRTLGYDPNIFRTNATFRDPTALALIDRWKNNIDLLTIRFVETSDAHAAQVREDWRRLYERAETERTKALARQLLARALNC